ncbi:MAG: DUF2497 domain-containing protein [Rickettsiales bacterium]
MAAAKDNGNADGEDQSMEDILQSIRKIIAEEGDEPAEESVEAEEEIAEEMPEEAVSDEEAVPDSDVLELTDAVQDDGSVVNVKNEGDTDVLEDIDEAISQPEPEPTPEPEPAPPPPAPAEKDDGLVSEASIAASVQAIQGLKAPTNLGEMPFVSGNTVEGLVAQMLRPMLKEWLDANLPGIVQKVVEAEVGRITAAMGDKK